MSRGLQVLLLGPIVAAVWTCAMAATPELRREPTPSGLESAVADAELWGRKLFEAYAAPKRTYGAVIEKAAETAHAAIKRMCPGRYIVLAPDERIEDGILIYEIAEHSEGVINIGGQSRILVSPDGATALSVMPSAKSCLTLEGPDIPGHLKVAAVVTHLLSPSPTEFHVLASLFAKQALFVATRSGVWVVDSGTIHYMGRLEQAPVD
jgi:hypothetical protein